MTFGFEWDDVNRAKVAAHGLAPEDCEQVFEADDLFAEVGNKPLRYVAYGTIEGPRFVAVVFTQTGEATIRVVTAYRVNPRRIKR
jgi:uncharacterized DUF497 family protein